MGYGSASDAGDTPVGGDGARSSPPAPPQAMETETAEEDAYDPFAVGEDGGGAAGAAAPPAPPGEIDDGAGPRRPLDRGVLPDAPTTPYDATLAETLRTYRSRGLNPTQQIRANREFHNPNLLQKIIEYWDIDDVASNHPLAIFDPAAIVARRSREKKPSSPKLGAPEAASLIVSPPPE